MSLDKEPCIQDQGFLHLMSKWMRVSIRSQPWSWRHMAHLGDEFVWIGCSKRLWAGVTPLGLLIFTWLPWNGQRKSLGHSKEEQVSGVGYQIVYCGQGCGGCSRDQSALPVPRDTFLTTHIDPLHFPRPSSWLPAHHSQAILTQGWNCLSGGDWSELTSLQWLLQVICHCVLKLVSRHFLPLLYHYCFCYFSVAG